MAQARPIPWVLPQTNAFLPCNVYVIAIQNIMSGHE